MPRRTMGAISDRSCPFGFNLRWNKVGFYISLEKNGGCPDHRYHLQLDSTKSIPSRLLADDDRETLCQLAAACCSTGVAGAYVQHCQALDLLMDETWIL